LKPGDKQIPDILKETAPQLEAPVYLVVYLHHRVVIGTLSGGEIRPPGLAEELTPAYLKELRLFSRVGELYVWKQAGTFKYRLRLDGEKREEKEEGTAFYDEEHFMWGKHVNKEGDVWLMVEPDRGMEIAVPFEVTPRQLPLKYRVRNYLIYKDRHLPQFFDARLVALSDKNGKEI
jgi:CRISPR-associated protein (TIGR03984 family)